MDGPCFSTTRFSHGVLQPLKQLVILYLFNILPYGILHLTTTATISSPPIAQVVQLKMPENLSNNQPKLKTRSANTSKTLTTAPPNLNKLVILSSSSGPVKDTEEVATYLVHRAFITSTNKVMATKLVNILFAVALENKIT